MNQHHTQSTIDGTLGAWTTSTPLPVTVSDSQAIVTKNRVYLMGGISTSSYSSTVYTAPINLDGTLGAWTTSTSLPDAVYASQAIVTKNRVYLLGGYTNGGYSSTVYTAPINLDGTLGAWTTSTSLPGTVADSQAIVTKNRVYLLGGHNGSADSSTVYTAPINLDGTLGTWTTSTSLPDAVYASQAIVTKNRVYLLGGISTSSYSSTVYTAPINLDGTLGAWTTSTSLPATVYQSQAIVTKNRVYLLGGFINGVRSSIIYTAPINDDGTLGAWTTSTPLPVTAGYSQAIVTKNRVYLLGGYINGVPSSTVYTAPIRTSTQGETTMQKLNKTLKDYEGAVNKSQEVVLLETAGDPAVTFVRLDSHTFDVWIAPNEEGQYIQSDIVIFNSLEEDCVSSGMKRIASKLLNTSQENLTMRHWRKFHTHSQGETTMHPDQRSVKQVMTDDFLAVANNNFNLTFTSIAEDGSKKKTAVTFVKVSPVCFEAWETNDLSEHSEYIRVVLPVDEDDDEKQFSMLRGFAAHRLGVKEKTLVATYNRYPIQPSKGKDAMQDNMNTTTADQPQPKEAVQEQRAVFPAVANEEGLCLSVGLNDHPSINAVSGNRYAPVETVSFVDPSMTVEVKTDQIGDTLVACVARMRKLRFIVYSCDGAKYFHILGAGQSMTGLHNSVVNDKVVYWVVNSDLKEELVILDTPKMNPVGGWVQKEDLLHLILPLYRGISSSTSIDPVLEAALRCASFQAIESYLTWAEDYSKYKYIYPDSQQTLKHLQGG